MKKFDSLLWGQRKLQQVNLDPAYLKYDSEARGTPITVIDKTNCCTVWSSGQTAKVSVTIYV